MKLVKGNLLLKQKVIQMQINEQLRCLSDSKYKQFFEDYDRLQKILTSATKIEENLKPEKFQGWTPIQLNLSPKSQNVAWLNLGQMPFKDASSYRTVVRSWQNQNRPEPIFTKLQTLIELQDVSLSLKPKGFIFNVSKCGSTLLSNMLCSIPRNLVMCENQVIHSSLMFNAFVGNADSISDSFRKDIFQSVLHALGQPRLGIEENYIIRFHPHNIFQIPFIKKVFPDVPSIFLYRDPVEVAVSNLIDQPSYRRIPELVRKVVNLSAIDIAKTSEAYPLVNKMIDFSARDIAQMSDEQLQARRLGLFFEIVEQYLVNQKVLLINYNQLKSESTIRKILDFFQIEVSDTERANMLAQLQVHSKDYLGNKAFRDDRADKQKMASSTLRQFIDKWAKENYIKLENIRQDLEKGFAIS